MAKSQRKSQRERAGDVPESEALVQLIGVYHVDLLAEVEGVLRSVTRAQQQVERLRPNSTTPGSASQRREALKLLAGNLKTLMSKVDTLRETLPEIESAVAKLQAATAAADDEAAHGEDAT